MTTIQVRYLTGELVCKWTGVSFDSLRDCVADNLPASFYGTFTLYADPNEPFTAQTLEQKTINQVSTVRIVLEREPDIVFTVYTPHSGTVKLSFPPETTIWDLVYLHKIPVWSTANPHTQKEGFAFVVRIIVAGAATVEVTQHVKSTATLHDLNYRKSVGERLHISAFTFFKPVHDLIDCLRSDKQRRTEARIWREMRMHGLIT